MSANALVAAPMVMDARSDRLSLNEPCTKHRADTQAGGQRKHLKARLDRRRSSDQLQFAGEVDDARGHSEPAGELQECNYSKPRNFRQAGRKERLSGCALTTNEQTQCGKGGQNRPDYLPGILSELVAYVSATMRFVP